MGENSNDNYRMAQATAGTHFIQRMQQLTQMFSNLARKTDEEWVDFAEAHPEAIQEAYAVFRTGIKAMDITSDLYEDRVKSLHNPLQAMGMPADVVVRELTFPFAHDMYVVFLLFLRA